MVVHRNIFADNWVNLKTFLFIWTNVAYNKIIHAQFLKNQIQLDFVHKFWEFQEGWTRRIMHWFTIE